METPYITIIFSILFFTGFVKIATVLSIFRYGIGLSGSGFGVVVLAISLALAFLSVEPFLKAKGSIETTTSLKTISEGEKLFAPFLRKGSDPQILNRFNEYASVNQGSDAKENTNDQSVKNQEKLSPLIAAFLTTELKSAFTLGLIILIPFLLIDLVVTNVLMVLSIKQIPYQVVSLPLKLLLFIAVDGWSLVTQQILSQYKG